MTSRPHIAGALCGLSAAILFGASAPIAKRLLVEVSMGTRRRYSLSFLMVATLSAACNRSIEPTSDTPAPPVPASATLYDFDGDELGKVPSGFEAVLAGEGSPGQWAVRASGDGSGPGRQVVAQTSDDDTSNRFPLLVRSGFQSRDLDVSVELKTISGDKDASGGLVFRYRDEGNFYVVRANSLEDNVVAYKMERGERDNVGVKGRGDAYGVKVEVPHGRWNTLRVIARGSTFEILLNGRKLFDVEDSTFSGPGRVGLWTKADAVTEFDNLRVQSLDAEP